jgi:hypothetical protein
MSTRSGVLKLWWHLFGIGAYDILAGLLRLKMQDCMTVSVFKTLYHFLGINLEKPE